MGLLKAIIAGLLVGLVFPSIADYLPYGIQDAARWFSFTFPFGEHELNFSVPAFAIVSLFSWLVIFGVRD